MELEGRDFHSKVADAYLKIAEEHPERFVLVDADQSPAEVFEDVRAALDKAPGYEALKTASIRAPWLPRRRPSGTLAMVFAVLGQVPGQQHAMAFLQGRRGVRTTRTCSPAGEAASRSPRERSRPHCSAAKVVAASAATAGWR